MSHDDATMLAVTELLGELGLEMLPGEAVRTALERLRQKRLVLCGKTNEEALAAGALLGRAHEG
jgi:hypothetical protein